MKTAIVYYSMSGNTAYAAEKIAAALKADLVEIMPQQQYPDKGFKKFFWGGKSAMMAETPKLLPYDFAADAYDQIIFGFPVWAGNITPPLRTFIQENAEALRRKRVAAFACQSGSGAEKAFRKLAECLGGTTVSPQLVLIDPKSRPAAVNDEKIAAFCEEILSAK